MSILTNLTRMWLTRSVRPFHFTQDNDPHLQYQDCDRLGLYVHIPFCRSLCDFCPYCKVVWSGERCNRYIDALLREIHLVGGEKRPVTSLYFGGGTPALAADRLGEIITALSEHFTITEGIGVELHPADVTIPVLRTLKDAGVTRISIGIQSFQEKFQTLLGRPPVHPEKLAAALAAVPFQTVSMDFIFALPGQTFEDLRRDVDAAFAHGANHIAIYPFIDFTCTASPLPAMEKGEKRALLDRITAYCAQQSYGRSSVWTFSNDPEAGYSSMTRDTFLGFGCSAVTLLRDQFKINTFDLESYCRQIDSGHLPTSLTLRFTPRQRMVYWLFWTAYSTRVPEADFQKFFGVPLRKEFGFALWLAQRLGFAAYQDGVYQMTPKGAFYYHYYENFYTLAYIDQMWGILRHEAFPESLVLR